jgi:hypothetical protein
MRMLRVQSAKEKSDEVESAAPWGSVALAPARRFVQSQLGLELLISKQNEEGRWRLEYTCNGLSFAAILANLPEVDYDNATIP